MGQQDGGGGDGEVVGDVFLPLEGRADDLA